MAVVERAEAEFAPGLTVLTGETGAGKSVLMGALELVLGGRADASIVRDGAHEAEVEADFGDFVVRRTVTTQGRSRAWINDESVSVAELKELGHRLVDIHGPTANQKMRDESFQRDALDAFAEGSSAQGGKAPPAPHEALRRKYAASYAELAECKAQFAAIADAGDEDALDMLRFQVGELEEAELTEDDETIAERHAAAAHAEEIVEAANEITDVLGGDRSAAEMLIRLQPRIRDVAKHLPAASEWAATVEDLTLKMQELSRTVADVVSKFDVGDEDLESLDQRLTLVNRLKRKYLKGADQWAEDAGRSGAVAHLMDLLKEKKAKLDVLEHREERLEELCGKIAAAEREVRKAGAALAKSRKAAAEKLSAAVTRELCDLGFPHARFFVGFEPSEPEPHGMDGVFYMFEPNPGESARPLAAIASSGEIARVMLALKVVQSAACRAPSANGDAIPATGASRRTPGTTLVFDEIDANIGGEVGRIVGEKLRAVARRHQVIAITHLPQSAVYGNRHLVVSKATADGRTRTKISEVEGEARVSEVARMLGGEKLTSVVKRHAEEMLQLSR